MVFLFVIFSLSPKKWLKLISLCSYYELVTFIKKRSYGFILAFKFVFSYRNEYTYIGN